jgi:hypothetical protein
MPCGEAELFCVSMGKDHTTTQFIPGCVRRLDTRSPPALGGFCSMKIDDSTATGLITERRLRRVGRVLVSTLTFLVRPMVGELRPVAKTQL